MCLSAVKSSRRLKRRLEHSPLKQSHWENRGQTREEHNLLKRKTRRGLRKVGRTTWTVRQRSIGAWLPCVKL
ncbi:hypothetical protein MHYP_G00099260 [Metynnis hypsauchen]